MYQEIITKYIPKNYQTKTDGNVITYNVLSADIAVVCKQLYFEYGLPLKIITAIDDRKENGGFKILYVFGLPAGQAGLPKENVFLAPYIILKDTEEFPSITRQIQQAFWHERKIKTFFGLNPVGHPDPRPLILHENWPSNVFPLRKDFNWQDRPAEANNTYE